MAYMTLKSGYCTGTGPGSSTSNAGGLRMYWELRFYTSAETVTIMNKSYACAAGSYKLFYKLQGWYGVEIGGKIRLINRIGTTAAAYVSFRNGSTNLWTMGTTDTNYASRNPSFGNNKPKNTWYDVGDATYSDTYRVYPSGLISVSAGATLSLNLTYNVGMWYSSTYNANASATSGSTSVKVTGGQSAISTITENPVTTNTFQMTVTRYNAAYWHKVTFKSGSTVLYTSAAFETSYSMTVPRSWFDSFTTDTSIPLTISLQTYSDQSCTTTIGSAVERSTTLICDPGMNPTIQAGFVTAAIYNTGTPAAGIARYVQGYSKAALTFDRSKLTLENNATAAKYTITCQDVSQDVNTPGASETAYTDVLTTVGTVPITITVTDSRGMTKSTSLDVTVQQYSPPTISGVDVFRCNSLGVSDENGNYVSVKATGNVSSVDGQNTLTLKAQYAVGSGGYGTASTLTSGTASVLGGTIDPDQKLRVLITATDALGIETTALRSFPTRTWAMKFRATGDGVAFGKAPEYGAKKLELPGDWAIMFGAETWLNKVYPVGSIYMSVNSTDPGTLFGGTWARIKDTFLLSAGDTYSAGDTGGEATHTLTEDEMPSHTHALYYYNASGDKSFGYNYGNKGTQSKQTTASGGIVNAGGGQAHNNMPPYLAVYVWRRTA